jgi:hypothetical protein
LVFRHPSEKRRSRVGGRSARPWPEFRARRDADTMADELKVRGTVVHDASVTRDPIAPRVSRLYADRRREGTSDRFSSAAA